MKKLGILILSLSFVFFSCDKKQAELTIASAENSQKIISTFVLGKVFVKQGQSDKWSQIKVGHYFKASDTVKVAANSKIHFQTETGSVFVLKELSEMKLISVLNPKTQAENTVLELNNGSVSVKPRKLNKDSKFYVRTPALVAGVRGTQFTVGHEAGNSKISVDEGTVAVKPSLNNEKAEEAIQPVNVQKGQKVELDSKVAAVVQKQVGEKDFKDHETISGKTIVVAPYIPKSEDKEDLKVLDIDLNLSKISLVPLTISSYGNEIFVNNLRVSHDYYSALYPLSKELDIVVKKSRETVFKKKITLSAEGAEIILTPESIINDENHRVINQTLEYSFKKVGENFPGNIQKMILTENQYIVEKVSQILVFENSQKKNEFNFDPKIKPAYSKNRIFSYQNGKMMVHQLSGEKFGEHKLSNVIFQNAITVFDGVAYLPNSTGMILGIDSEGKKVFEFSIKDSIISPVILNFSYLVAASPYVIYVIDYKNKKLVNSFNLGRAKVFKRIGIMKDSIIISQDNNVIQIVDIHSKKTLKTIAAVPGNIEVINDSLFAVRYFKKMAVFNLSGELIKEVNHNPDAAYIAENRIIYADGRSLFIDDFKSEKKINFPEDIELVSRAGAKILVLCKNGVIYELAE